MNDETSAGLCRIFGNILKTVCPESYTEFMKKPDSYWILFSTPHLIQEFEGETADSVIELASDFIESVLLDPTLLQGDSNDSN